MKKGKISIKIFEELRLWTFLVVFRLHIFVLIIYFYGILYFSFTISR